MPLHVEVVEVWAGHNKSLRMTYYRYVVYDDTIGAILLCSRIRLKLHDTVSFKTQV
jgi:hypothetical protein